MNTSTNNLFVKERTIKYDKLKKKLLASFHILCKRILETGNMKMRLRDNHEKMFKVMGSGITTVIPIDRLLYSITKRWSG